jgi:hypothetical protein
LGNGPGWISQLLGAGEYGLLFAVINIPAETADIKPVGKFRVFDQVAVRDRL